MAPMDWELLKLSGWGSGRMNDIMNSSIPAHPPHVSDKANITLKTSLWSQFTKAFRSMFDDEDTDVTFFQMREPFTEPAIWNWGTLGWGSPTYFYAGTGGYIVRGSA